MKRGDPGTTLMGIQLVSPVPVSSENNAPVLALLEHVCPAGSARHVQVPVQDSAEATALLQRIQRQAKRKRKEAGDTSDDETAARDGESETPVSEALLKDTEDDPDFSHSFVPLSQFQPKTRLEQVTTAFYPRFPNLKKQHVASILGRFLADCPYSGAEATFSHLDSVTDDFRGLYVRFPSCQITRWVQEHTGQVLEPEAVFDSELSGDVESTDLGAAKKDISAIFHNRHNYVSAANNTKDLDAVMEYYRTYKVENSDLVEVPKDMKDTIVRNIIRFRSHVLLLERENRKKEHEKERRLAKRRLTQIYESIRSRSGDDSVDKAEVVEATKESPGSDLSDDAYEAFLAEKEAAAIEAEYADKTQQLHQEEAAKTALLSNLAVLEGYETHLMENKLAYMDDLKILETTVPKEVPPELTISALYHTNPREYLRIRNIEKTKEEAWEAEERALMAQEQSALQPSVVVEEKPVKEVEMDRSVVIRDLGAENLALVKNHISSLVEDYLGVKEEVLIDYVYDFLMKHDLEQKDELVAELSETLDEDSLVVVDSLYEFVKKL